MLIVESLLSCYWTDYPLNKYTVLVLLYQNKCFKIVIELLCVLNISAVQQVKCLIFVHGNL
jgi:hypothetical protein